LEYLQELSGPFAFSFSYLNEGHLDRPDEHHRDGFVFQTWARKSVFAPWFSIAAGLGPYYWYDSQLSTSGSEKFVRGFGIISSASANIHLPWDGLYLQGRFNWVEANNNISTKAVLFGVGTDFSSSDVLNKHLPELSNNKMNEVLLLFDPFSSDSIGGIEYRRNLGILENHVEVSVSYLFDNDEIFKEDRSYGVTAQIWAVNKFKDRFKFGIGTGVFVDLLESWHNVSNVISILFAFQISNHWNLQICHSRIHPDINEDEDIRTIAVGYLF
jgi:hypothetical protein